MKYTFIFMLLAFTTNSVFGNQAQASLDLTCRMSPEDKKHLGLDSIANSNHKVKVAFIGDQGLEKGARELLEFIKKEGADLVVHQGDLIYGYPEDQVDNRIGDLNKLGNEWALKWEKMINEKLGKNFPYLASIGNHDQFAWDSAKGLKYYLSQRVQRISDIKCVGDHGINSICTFKGLVIALSGVGTYGKGHNVFLSENLACGKPKWRICSWHKNMTKMQAGNKSNETGWEPYEICRKAGAIVATGHEHSYSRTFLMSSFQHQQVVHKKATMTLRPGHSVAFVNGLGGHSIRTQKRNDPWFAKIYTYTQKAKFAALFCEFKPNNDGSQAAANCQLKNTDNEVIDGFLLKSAL